MRALMNDKYAAFTQLYGPLGIKTTASDIPDILAGQYDICLTTNEKFADLALGIPKLLEQISLIVIDEAQMIADPERGATLEFLLTMLKVRTFGGHAPQVVLLSA